MADPIPTPGDPSTLFERLRDHVQPYDPDVFVRARGASDEQLERYAALSGFGAAIPESYRSFLHGMGSDDGGLFVDLRLDTKLSSILELYEDCIESPYDSVSADLPVAALYIVGDQVSFDRTSGSTEPPLVDSSDGELVRPHAASWEALAMQAAVLRVEPRRLPHARWYSSSPNGAAQALAGASAADVVDAFAAKLGLPIAWPSDPWHRIAVDEHHGIFAKIAAKEATVLYAFSADEFFLRRVGSELAPALGATSGGILRIIDGALKDSPT